jgi:tetratricopeptide (TPR) repeat protein
MRILKLVMIVFFFWNNDFIYGDNHNNYISDETVMEARRVLYDGIRTFNRKKLMEAESLFERMLFIDSKMWIADYYIALADEYISYTYDTDGKQQEKYIDKGIEHLEHCIGLENKFSEAYIMLACLYGAKIELNPNQAISLHSKMSAALGRAGKLESDNPRLYFVTGRSCFYTPEVFGGGFTKAKEELNKALELYPLYKVKKEIYPDWGYSETYSYLGQIAVREEQFEQAGFYYSKALEIDSNNMYVKYRLLSQLKTAMQVDVPVITPGGGIFLEMDSVTVEMEHEKKYPIYYTLDGSEPSINSRQWSNVPLIINKNTTVKARAVASMERQSEIVTAQFQTGKLSPSADSAGMEKGLRYAYYEGIWNKLPDFDTLQALETGITDKISLDRKKRKDQFGFVFWGFIDMAQAGDYVFYLRSDDGGRLSIDNKKIIDNDGVHDGHLEKSYQIPLDRGKHGIKLVFFENVSREALEVNYKGPGIKKQELNKKTLYHK